ncbi:MAG TPA: hypothetical protein PK691_04075 [Thermomicrobiales bacterium]|nr:hypothetical protein [Thermomicrobiales bacterium]
MTEFQVSDVVRVEMPRGYTNRGVLGVSLMFVTSPEAKFEGAIGTVTEINPVGPQSVAQFLVDFRTHDNSRVGIPWQAQWFREEWLDLRERPKVPETPTSKTEAATQTWPTRPAVAPATAGIAHPEAKLFTEGSRDFAPQGADPASIQTSELSADALTIAHPDAPLFTEAAHDFAPAGGDSTGIAADDSAMGINVGGSTANDRIPTVDDRSAAQPEVFTPDTSASIVVERGEGWIKVENTTVCPDGFPIKGNANSGIYHAPTDKTFTKTIPEICFESEAAALAMGFRAPKNRG